VSPEVAGILHGGEIVPPPEAGGAPARKDQVETSGVGVELTGNLLERLGTHAMVRPDAPCGVSSGLQVSYAQLHRASDELAARLHASAIRAGSTQVASVLAERSPRLLTALLASMKAGLAFNVIDPRYPRKRTSEYLRYLDPAVVIDATGDRRAETDLAEGLARSTVSRIVAVDTPAGRSGGPVPEPLVSRSDRAADFPMYVAFTSGTTGLPKAVWGSHGPVAHFFEWQAATFSIGAGDRVSVLSGLAHDPLLRDLLMPIWTGASCWFPPEEVFTTPGALYSWLLESAISVMHATPSLISLLLNVPRSDVEPRLPSLRHIFLGGEPLHRHLAARLQALAPAAQIVNCYGATETPQVMAWYRVTPAVLQERQATSGPDVVPIGTGIDGVEVLLLDGDNRVVDAGQTGEICIRTRYRAARIEDTSGESASGLAVNPLTGDPDDLIYRTGDYGYRLPDGDVVCVGRHDRQVKVRGYRVDLGEVERAVAAIPCVGHFHVDVCVRENAASIVLFVVPRHENEPADLEAIRLLLGQALPQFMTPHEILTVENLPLTPNGKVDRETLLDLVSGVRESDASGRPADQGDLIDSGIAKILVGLRQMRFPLLDSAESIGPMDSLQVIEFLCALQDEFGEQVPPELLRKSRTLAELAVGLSGLGHGERGRYGSQESGDATSSLERAPVTEPPRTRGSPAGALRRRPPWIPRRETAWGAVRNRLLQLVARVAPDPVRVACHRRRGVALGEGVSLGYDTVIETAFPNLVKIGNGVNVGMRVTIIAHFRGMEGSDTGPPTVVIEDDAFIGPGAIILPNVTIGRAAVVAAGSVVSSSVPPLTFVHGNPAKPVARCGVPLTGETTYEEFLRSLIPLGPQAGPMLPGLNRRPSSAGAGSSTDRVSRGAIATTDDN